VHVATQGRDNKYRQSFSQEIFNVGSRSSSVSTVSRLRAGRPGPKSGRGNVGTFPPSPSHPDRFWAPPSLLSSDYWGRFPRGKAAGAWSSAIPPLTLTSSWCGT